MQRICSNGHTYQKTSACPVCPICEKMRTPEADFLSTIKKFCPHCGLKLCRCNRVPVKTFKTV